jgi:hypothetical protein
MASPVGKVPGKEPQGRGYARVSGRPVDSDWLSALCRGATCSSQRDLQPKSEPILERRWACVSVSRPFERQAVFRTQHPEISFGASRRRATGGGRRHYLRRMADRESYPPDAGRSRQGASATHIVALIVVVACAVLIAMTIRWLPSDLKMSPLLDRAGVARQNK